MTKRIFKNGSTHVPDFCRPMAEILARIGDKWSLSILGSLREERRRFSELQGSVPGISQRMLTMTLRALERDGLVARFVHPTVPPRVDYELTPMGQELIVALAPLSEWADANTDSVRNHRRAFDADARDNL